MPPILHQNENINSLHRKVFIALFLVYFHLAASCYYLLFPCFRYNDSTSSVSFNFGKMVEVILKQNPIKDSGGDLDLEFMQ